MSARDRLLAVLVAVVWGLNYLAVRVGLDHYPPVFMSALRFVVLAVPVVLFVPWPKVKVRWLVLYGLGYGVLQFGLLFLAMDQGMPAGQASVVVEASAPFTVLLGLLLGERVTGRQVVGIVLAAAGLTAIAVERARGAALLPLVLTLLAALGWALGNIAGRKARPDHPLRFALWMSVVPPLPLLALSAILEGPTTGWRAFGASFSAEGVPGLVALLYAALAGSVVGAGIWTILLKRYEAGTVAPFSMLVPVVGVAVSWIFLDERLSASSAVASAAIVAGVLVGSTTRRPRPADRAGDPAGQPEPVPPVPAPDVPAIPPAPGQSSAPASPAQKTQRS
ncbi:EamA family transporter [Streptomyces sp. NPDC048717]|uniref:EamA family transporter n=1 Tax=Streptomyces sp. NPDC048717 TaxID=3154928 RepID=UPI00343321F8